MSLKPCTYQPCCKIRKKFDIYCSMHRARLDRTGKFELVTPYERMMKKVIIDKNGCWIFGGFITNYGYGRVRNNGFKYLTHRLSWEERFGSIPEDMLVCHKCDVPSCVNPDHLFLGTPKTNHQDAINKGRINPSKRGKERWTKCPTLRKM